MKNEHEWFVTSGGTLDDYGGKLLGLGRLIAHDGKQRFSVALS